MAILRHYFALLKTLDLQPRQLNSYFSCCSRFINHAALNNSLAHDSFKEKKSFCSSKRAKHLLNKVPVRSYSYINTQLQSLSSSDRLLNPAVLSQYQHSLSHKGSTRNISNMAAEGIKCSWGVTKEQIQTDTDKLMLRVKAAYDSIGALKNEEVSYDNVVKVSTIYCIFN